MLAVIFACVTPEPASPRLDAWLDLSEIDRSLGSRSQAVVLASAFEQVPVRVHDVSRLAPDERARRAESWGISSWMAEPGPSPCGAAPCLEYTARGEARRWQGYVPAAALIPAIRVE